MTELDAGSLPKENTRLAPSAHSYRCPAPITVGDGFQRALGTDRAGWPIRYRDKWSDDMAGDG